ncbi:unnamed protein product [Mytilus edulis]|uniref:Uncharacterized protein n=1 Tax=Mytilus edulis TaxID=6550 RepID=A0A8S3PYD3_MYTED|nr:unnamed protein product [Mytilus edulis]
MTDRNIGHYRHILLTMKVKIQQITRQRWRPTKVICDFELALKAAVETELPNAQTSGWYFHSNQSLWRKVQNLDLAATVLGLSPLEGMFSVPKLQPGRPPQPMAMNQKHMMKYSSLVRSDIKVEVEQKNMTDYLSTSEERQKLKAQSTQQDKTLQQLIQTIENDWNNSQHTSELDPFYIVHEERSVQNGFIFKGDRCIILNAMKNKILSQIQNDISIEGCLKRAQECL